MPSAKIMFFIPFVLRRRSKFLEKNKDVFLPPRQYRAVVFLQVPDL